MGLTDRLSRQTTSGRFIPEIDGLRFVAIFSVILYHVNWHLMEKAAPEQSRAIAQNFLHQQLNFGRYGVELFFAISGFILAVPFISQYLLGGKKVSLRLYFLRRLTRLEPPYILNLLFLFTLLVAAKGYVFGDTLKHLLASLIYQHNTIFGDWSTINSAAWSLEIEVQFYTLVPLLALVFLIRSRWVRRFVIMSAALAETAVQLYLLPHSGSFATTIAQYLQYFLMGFVLADIYLIDWKEQRRHSYQWDLLGVLAWSGLALAVQEPTIRAFLFPPLTLLAYMAAFQGRFFNWLFTRKLLTVIGGMCYTIYLFHNVIISGAALILLKVGYSETYELYFLVQAIIMSVIIVVIGSILFVLVERPFMDPRWPQRASNFLSNLFGKRQSSAAAQ